MKKYAFIIAILGIAILLGLLALGPKEIGSSDDFEAMEINEKIIFKGMVIDEKDFVDFRILKLQGKDFEVICDCVESYIDKEVEIVGVVDEFNGKRQVRVLRIGIID